MKTKIKIDDFLMLIGWVEVHHQLEHSSFSNDDLANGKVPNLKNLVENFSKPFKYQNLLDQAYTNKLADLPIDTKINHVDDFMVDVYRIYNKIIDTESKIDITDVYKQMTASPGLDKEMMKQIKPDLLKGALDDFKKIFLDIIYNYEFEGTEIRGIQKNFIQEKLNYLIENEEYEEAAIFRDKLKTF